MKGGTMHGQYTICRNAVSPYGVPGFHQPDPRRVSAAGPALRGRLPSPYGGVAPRWEAADSPPVCRVPELPTADPRRSSLLYSRLCENLRAASGPRPPVRHGPEQSQSVDPCPLARTAGGPAHPRRCPRPFAGRTGPAARRLRSCCRDDGCPAGGGSGTWERHTGLPPFAHDGTERRIVRPQDAAEQKESYSGKKRDHTVKNVLLVHTPLTILFLSATSGGRVHDLRIAAATPYPLTITHNFRELRERPKGQVVDNKKGAADNKFGDLTG